MATALNHYIHGRAKYQVVAPVVVAKQISGTELYIYHNGILPAGTLPSQIDHMVTRGMVRELEEVNQ